METPTTIDMVNSPPHYTQYKVEVIDLIEGMPYCRGCAIKYIARAGYKPPSDGQTQVEKELEDLHKALWMLNREIARVERQREGMKKPSEGEGFNR